MLASQPFSQPMPSPSLSRSIDVDAHDLHGTAHVRRAVALAARAVDVAVDGDAGARVVRIALAGRWRGPGRLRRGDARRFARLGRRDRGWFSGLGRRDRGPGSVAATVIGSVVAVVARLDATVVCSDAVVAGSVVAGMVAGGAVVVTVTTVSSTGGWSSVARPTAALAVPAIDRPTPPSTRTRRRPVPSTFRNLMSPPPPPLTPCATRLHPRRGGRAPASKAPPAGTFGPGATGIAGFSSLTVRRKPSYRLIMSPVPDVTPSAEDRVLDALRVCCERWGFDRVTVDDIAAEAGISRATALPPVPRRQGRLFEALRSRETQDFFVELERPRGRGRRPRGPRGRHPRGGHRRPARPTSTSRLMLASQPGEVVAR